MRKTCILVLFMFVTAGCQSIPAIQDTPMAAYKKLIVRNINWKETATCEIEGDEIAEFVAAQPKLNEIFRAEFTKHITHVGFFDKVNYGDLPSDANTLILEPKIYTLCPGIRTRKMGSASFTGILKNADGKLVGTYTEERRVGSSLFSTMMGNIETLVAELAEDAASHLSTAR